MTDRKQGMGRPTINDRPSADRGTSAVVPPRPLVVKVTPYPVHPMSKSEGYIFPFFNTERRIGEFSRELETHERIRTDLTANHDGEQIQTKTQVLKDVGIDIAHASRYEAIASIPKEEKLASVLTTMVRTKQKLKPSRM